MHQTTSNQCLEAEVPPFLVNHPISCYLRRSKTKSSLTMFSRKISHTYIMFCYQRLWFHLEINLERHTWLLLIVNIRKKYLKENHHFHGADLLEISVSNSLIKVSISTNFAKYLLHKL